MLWDNTNPPRPPNFESLPYPRGGGRFDLFFARKGGKDERKGTRSNFASWLRVFEHRDKNLQTPSSEN